MKVLKKIEEVRIQLVIILILGGTLASLIINELEIYQLEFENEKLKTRNEQLELCIDELEQELLRETVELNNCPKCKGTVEIMQTMDRYHIKCSDCGLGTKAYESKDELVEYWNEEGR